MKVGISMVKVEIEMRINDKVIYEDKNGEDDDDDDGIAGEGGVCGQGGDPLGGVRGGMREP